MVTIKSENTRPFDVDGTIILPVTSSDPHNSRYVRILDPIDPTSYLRFRVHEPMVRLLKEEFHRGSCIIVHSRGGWAWAEAVVDALGLRPYVHYAKSKDLVYFDDCAVGEWLKDRVFLDPNLPYKQGE